MLKGLLVVETAGVLAGPSVGMFLAELGARVVKLENPGTGGDVTRAWKLPSEPTERSVSAYFCSVNHGKEHRFVDLKGQEGRASLDELLRHADVLLTNHMEGDADKLGLARSRIATLNPRLVHGHIRGYMNDRERPAFDVVLQAETGYIGMSGTEEHPAKMPVAMVDVLAGHQLKEGILLALLRRERTGEGAYVEVSLEEAAFSGLVNQASNYLMAGHSARPMGTLHPNIAPYGELFTTADGGRVVLAVGSDTQFRKLCAELGLQDLATCPDYATNAQRVRNRQALARELSAALGVHKRDEVLERLRLIGVPAGAVLDIAEALNSPTARAMVLREEMDGNETVRLRGNVFRIGPLAP